MSVKIETRGGDRPKRTRDGERGAVMIVFALAVGMLAAGAATVVYTVGLSRQHYASKLMPRVRAQAAAESVLATQLQAIADAENNELAAIGITNLGTWGKYTLTDEGAKTFRLTTRAEFDRERYGLSAFLKEPIHELFRKSIYAGNQNGGEINLRFGPDRVNFTRKFTAGTDASFNSLFKNQDVSAPDTNYVNRSKALKASLPITGTESTDGVMEFGYRSQNHGTGKSSSATTEVGLPGSTFPAAVKKVLDSKPTVEYQRPAGFAYGTGGTGTATEKSNGGYSGTWDPTKGPIASDRFYFDVMPDENLMYVYDSARKVNAATAATPAGPDTWVPPTETAAGYWKKNPGTAASAGSVEVTKGTNILAIYRYADAVDGGIGQNKVVTNPDVIAGSVYVNKDEAQTSDSITIGKAGAGFGDPGMLVAQSYDDISGTTTVPAPSDIATDGTIGAGQYVYDAAVFPRIATATAGDLATGSNGSVTPEYGRIPPPDLTEQNYLGTADVIVRPPTAGKDVYQRTSTGAIKKDSAGNVLYNDQLDITSNIGGYSPSSDAGFFIRPSSYMNDVNDDVPRFFKDATNKYDATKHDKYMFVLGSDKTATVAPSNDSGIAIWGAAEGGIPTSKQMTGAKYNTMEIDPALNRKTIYVDGNLVVEPDGARILAQAVGGGDGKREVTVVVKGNIYLADALMASSKDIGLVFIAIGDDASYEDANNNGKFDTGERLIGTGSYAKEGSGNIYFGDTSTSAADPIGVSTAYLYAQNNFHVLAPNDKNKGQEFGIIGNMTAGNKIFFNGRGKSTLYVKNDTRLGLGKISPKGLPRSFSYRVASWTFAGSTEVLGD